MEINFPNYYIKEIEICYSQYMNNNNYVFKTLSDNFIAILKKLDDTITNEDRFGVIFKENAKFRANKLECIQIFSKFDPKDTRRIGYSLFSGFIYEVGKIILPDNYDENIDIICAPGIHYFLSLNATFYYDMSLKIGNLNFYYILIYEESGSCRIKFNEDLIVNSILRKEEFEINKEGTRCSTKPPPNRKSVRDKSEQKGILNCKPRKLLRNKHR